MLTGRKPRAGISLPVFKHWNIEVFYETQGRTNLF